jgi:diaminohydroxyphosphoribosylaminopyrimidine deaminase/5-amino-6-(5-phosphoribosylamino)uracil reductase
MPWSLEDHKYMARALRLAARAMNTTTPNPRVGCVLVRDGRVVGDGWHERAGEPHAEVHALRAARRSGTWRDGLRDARTLQPFRPHAAMRRCADRGRRRAGRRRDDGDPDERVAGRGFERLRAAGIAVDTGLMEAEARELNIGFVSRTTRGRPWLRVKIAATLDGKTALPNGESQWITGPDARRDGHRLARAFVRRHDRHRHAEGRRSAAHGA